MSHRCVLLSVVCLLVGSGSGQVSKPIVKDSDIDVENNKFLQRRPDLDYKQRTREEDEETAESMKLCRADIHLRWMSQVSSSIYGTPIVTDLFSDNKKEIIVPSHVHYLEVLEAEDGASAVGWPVYHKSHLHGSPFMYDIDVDGILDIGAATYNGEIQFFKDTGEKMQQSMSVSPLKVHRDWYIGLSPDPTDHSHLDVGDGKKEEKAQKTRRRLLADQQQIAEENGEKLTDWAADSFKVFDESNDEDDENYGGRITFNSRRRGGVLDEQEIDEEMYQDMEEMGARYDGWDDDMDSGVNEHFDREYVYLDGHILSTPVVADLDGDGSEELIVAVSYFFDTDFYSRSDHDLLPKGIDINNYMAGGVVVFDLEHRYTRWSVHLDMTRLNTTYAAYMTSAPSILDIDGDGLLEIVVGTHVGFVYVIDSAGATREGWPKQMGSIIARPLVDDLNGDGKVEILSVDINGNVAMFDIDGTELWERHLGSAIIGSPTAGASSIKPMSSTATGVYPVGDVTGNGELDIVIGTSSGHVYVLDPKTGQDRAPFPFRVHGSIRAPITITKMKETLGQQLVLTSFDGFLYVIDGETACVDAKDIGEDSYSMVLVDDLTGDGKLDLVVATMNGNILLFETNAPYHPLRSWTAMIRGTESAVARSGHVGIFASKESRVSRDVRGEKFSIRFAVVDERPTGKRASNGPYNVSIVLKNVGVNEMNMGSAPVVGVKDRYTKPGIYELTLPCPKTRSTALVQVTMKDRYLHEFKDEFSLSFHIHWYKFMKFMIAVPFTAMAMVAVLIKPHLLTLPS